MSEQKGGIKKGYVIAIVIAIVLAVLFSILAAFYYTSYKRKPAETKTIELPTDVTWQASWIWGDFEENDSWLMARKTFSLEEEPKERSAIAYIAADSKYWLYVNGELVVRDGGLKRGQTRTSTFYDVLDLSPYLKKGENCIACRVWYWGEQINCSYISSGQAGLCLQLETEEATLCSDETWRVRRDDAFNNEHNLANGRLPETDIWYDASKEVGDWVSASYEESDTEGWKDATVVAKAGEDPFGEMIVRTVPQFKDSEEKDYENNKGSKLRGSIKDGEEIYVMDLPYNAQVYPVLEVEAPAGRTITIKSDYYSDNNGDSVMTTYITKEGEQKFETPGWMNGERIVYEVPTDVTIKNLSYVETGYDTEFTGSFSCDDAFYNELWEKAQRTVYVNMRDTYMDCPNRERAGWIADAALDMNISMYSMDEKSHDMFKSMVYTLIGNGNDGAYLSTNPCTPEVPVVSIQNQVLMMYPAIMEYYHYTGDEEFLKDVYDPLYAYVTNNWVANEEGIYDYTLPLPRWDWGDSTENVDYYPVENCWVYSAFNSLEEMAVIFGKEEDAAILKEKKDTLKSDFQKAYWTEEGYKSKDQKVPDERANALTVVCGIADEDQYDTIAAAMEKSSYSTPLLEYYVEKAFCMMGKNDLALSRMKKRYDCMINAPAEEETSTLWEYFAYGQGTQNHGWTAGPLVILSKYVAGIEPERPGYDICRVVPNLGDLSELHSVTDTVKGSVTVDASYDKEKTALSIKVSSEEEMNFIVGVEKVSENPTVKFGKKEVYKDGAFKEVKNLSFEGEDDSYLYFKVTGKDVSFESR